MVIELNFHSGKAAYLQIVDQIKTAAASGVLRPGEALPGIRPLAERLRINRNTVAKAYAELERQGIAENRAGRGCFVSENSSPFKKSVREQLLVEAVDTAIVQAFHLQVSPEEFLKVVKERLACFSDKQNAAGSSPTSTRGTDL
jgi:GntR family transcriptional regulator